MIFKKFTYINDFKGIEFQFMEKIMNIRNDKMNTLPFVESLD